MPGPDLPPFLLPQAVAITLTTGIFLGFYLISVAFANRWLILTDEGWKFRKNIHWYTLIATNIVAVLVFLDEGVNISTPVAESGFVEQGNKPDEYIEPSWRPIIRCILFDIISLLTDTVLMYRLWVACMKRVSVILFPSFLWLGGFACVIMQTFLQIKNLHDPNFGPYQWSKVDMNVGPGIVAVPFLASTIVLNAYCTGLLVWRVWKTLKHRDSESSNAPPGRLQFLIRILMESGVFFLSISIAHFLVYFGHDNFAIHMIGTLNTIVIGIAYNLIIIHVGMNRTEDERRLNNQMLSNLVFQSPRTGGISVTSVTAPRLRDKEYLGEEGFP